MRVVPGIGLASAVAALLNSACLPDAFSTTCSANSDCPTGYTCSAERQFCVVQLDASGADRSAALDGGRDGQRVESGADAAISDRALADATDGAALDHADARVSDAVADDHAAAPDANVPADVVARPDTAERPDTTTILDIVVVADTALAADRALPGDAGCPEACADRAPNARYCSADGRQVLHCSREDGGCLVESVLDQCEGGGLCTDNVVDVWCAPEIVSLSTDPATWVPPAGVTMVVATNNADTCHWGLTAVSCDGRTTIAPTYLSIGCTDLDLTACNGVHCASQRAYAFCSYGSPNSCTFMGWGNCP